MSDLSQMTPEELRNYLLDFDSVPDEDILPDATYDAIVIDATLEEGTKAPYVALIFKISKGEWKDNQVWHNMTLVDKPFPRRRLKQAAAAILGEAPGKVSSAKLVTMLKGKPCRIATGQERYEGELRTRVSRILKKDDIFAEVEVPSEEIDELFGSTEPEEGNELPF